MRLVLRSKIHRATVTEANVEYAGSITIDEDLLKNVGLWPSEKVLVASVTSGARLETYVVKGKANSGMVCVNGAAARLIKRGEKVIIMGFELTNKKIKTKSVMVDGKNKIVKKM